MIYNIEITFRKSSSRYYSSAIKRANKFNNFQEANSAKEFNRLTVESEELRVLQSTFNELIDIVRSWKGTEIQINGKAISGLTLNKILNVASCHTEYTEAVIQENHCKNHDDTDNWGCKHLNTISRFLNDNSYYHREKGWFTFGNFKSKSIWHIAQEKIIEVLEREAELKYLHFCPIFDFNKVRMCVDDLPDSIDLNESDAWEIRYQENIDGSTLEKQAVGIQPKGADNSYRRGGGISISLGGDTEDKEEVTRFTPGTTYDEIGGIEGILQSVREIIEIPQKNPDLFKHLGIKPHKGVLLHGPPGCGKTLIAKAIANQVQAHFISIKGPELISKWHGQSEENLRNIFEEARKFSPSIIFFDEIDSIAQRRSSEETLRLDSRFVNQLLTLMDGMEEYADVKIIATTNRIELLDEALLRSGRFDYHIKVEKPDLKGCRKIFYIHTREMPIEPGFNSTLFASHLLGLTGSDIAFVAREAAYNCMRRVLSKQLSDKDFDFSDVDLNTLMITEIDFLKAQQLVNRDGRA